MQEKKKILEELEWDAEHFEEVQEKTLLLILEDNRNCEYGKQYHFGELKNVEQFQKGIPITDYEDYRNYIERMLFNHESGLLTAYPVRYYLVSSGTTGERKYLPMTDESIDQYSHYSYECAKEMAEQYYASLGEQVEWNGRIFMINELRCHQLTDNICSVLVSSAVFVRQKTRDAFPFERYTSPKQVLFPDTGQENDMNYLKLRFALECEDVQVMQGVYVHQLLNVLNYLEGNWSLLVDDIAAGRISEQIEVSNKLRVQLEGSLNPNPERAAELKREFKKGFADPIVPRIWKQIRYVMAISGDVFTAYEERLKKYIGNIPYHYFIYAASEGLFGAARAIGEYPGEYVLAPRAGFYEFHPVDAEEEILLRADGLKAGSYYELIYTGYNGFYRYRMGDVVRIVDFYHKVPVVKFAYRKKQCMNVAGEKMDMQTISRAIAEFADELRIRVVDFCMYQDLERVPGRYQVFIEAETEGQFWCSQKEQNKLLDLIFREQNIDYDDCRKLKEIGEPQIFYLQTGTFERYRLKLMETGKEVGQYKPIRLIDDEEKREFFFGEIISDLN